MDHSNVIKRAWEITRAYRALWIFGLILALTTLSWGAPLFLTDRDARQEGYQGIEIQIQPGESFYDALQRTVEQDLDELNTGSARADRDVERFFATELDVEMESDIRAVLIALASILVATFIVAKIARYVAEVALIRTVDDYKETGERHSMWRGLRLGCSRSAWRLFLIDLVINTPIVVAFILLFALALSPLLLWSTDNAPAGALGTLTAVGLFFAVITFAVLVAAVLSLLKPFFRRACTLEGLGVMQSIRRGYTVVRQHVSDAGLMWLVWVSVSFAWPVFMLPVVVALLGAGVVFGGTAALMAGALASAAFAGAVPWILAALVGITVFVLTLAAPLAILTGLREVFLSSVWTLTYRELRPRESVEAEHLPKLDPSRLKAAPVA
jgi:hypothetical protein